MSVRLVGLILSLTIFACSSNETVKQTPVGMKHCDDSSSIVKKSQIDLEGNSYTLYWSDHAGKKCPGPGFPRIVIDHPTVKYWIHVVRVDIPYKVVKAEYSGWLWHLSDNEDIDWIMLDIGKDHREKKIPFYNDVRNRFFHDNPAWGPIHKNAVNDKREWKGFLYGFESKEMKNSIVQISWGFIQRKGQKEIESIRSKVTDRLYLDLFTKKFQN